jgi:hypothetical protein
MTDFARGFRLHLRGGQVLDGAAFPSGRCLVIDDPEFGLASVAATEEDLLRGYPDARIEWPNEDSTARNAPPTEQCGFRHDQWDGPYRMPRQCTAPAGHTTGRFAYDHGPWQGLPKDAR